MLSRAGDAELQLVAAQIRDREETEAIQENVRAALAIDPMHKLVLWDVADRCREGRGGDYCQNASVQQNIDFVLGNNGAYWAEVASEALQLFGGNGLTKEYAIEKILRDARASMIEDGENNVLNLKGMRWLSRWYQEKQDISV